MISDLWQDFIASAPLPVQTSDSLFLFFDFKMKVTFARLVFDNVIFGCNLFFLSQLVWIKCHELLKLISLLSSPDMRQQLSFAIHIFPTNFAGFGCFFTKYTLKIY